MKLRTWMAFALGVLPAVSVWSQGRGPGMMGDGYGMGPGMMGSYGMGPGMMGGGYGMGPGMMWGYAGNAIPNLTDEQRDKIATIEKGFRQKQWDLMQKMHELNYQSGGFTRDGKFDEQAVRKAYDARAALHKQMFENALEERKQIDAVLTPQQRQQLQGGSRGRP